ncbi:MAG: hypothetical protein LBG80_10470 [Bacteroidales bacterium]|jgi:hypothetical protein|nr:hypothetical protein [Bacteroidales bacterium]
MNYKNSFVAGRAIRVFWRYEFYVSFISLHNSLNKQFYSIIAPAGKSKAGALSVEVIFAQLPNNGCIKGSRIENRFYKIAKTKLQIVPAQ